MKTIQTTFLLLIFCLLGCTSTHTLRPGHEAGYAALNKHAGRQDAIVTFIDGRKVGVEKLRITPDSTYWTYTNKIATTQISGVKFRRPGWRVKRWNLDHEVEQTSLYEKINKQTLGRGVILSLKNGQELKVRQLWMTSDFTSWTDPRIKQQPSPTYLAVASSQIKDVRFISRGSGAGLGIIGGTLLGALGGLVAISGEDCSSGCIVTPGEVAIAFGIIGAMIGAPVGAIIGHHDVYQIKHDTATGTN